MVGTTSYGLRPPIRPPLHTTQYTTASETVPSPLSETVPSPESAESSDTRAQQGYMCIYNFGFFKGQGC